MGLRLLLADLRPIFRAGLRSLFSQAPSSVEFIDEVTTVDTLICKLHSISFDLMIAHQSLVTELSILPKDHFVLLVVQPDRVGFQTALDQGALGYLSENTSPELLKATLDLHPGDFLIEPSFARWAFKVTTTNHEPSMESEALTQREREIFTLRNRGLSPHQIAEQLCITESTVKRHVANIAVKFRQRREMK